jgi:hypothetical protein
VLETVEGMMLKKVVSGVELWLGANVKVGTTNEFVLFGQIAMPSMIHGSLGVGHASEGSVGFRAMAEVEDISMVWVTVTTTVLVILPAVGAVDSLMQGRARTLTSSGNRPAIK